MTQGTVFHEGALTYNDKGRINDNFTELYNAVKNGTGAIAATTIAGTTGTFTGAVTGLQVSKTVFCSAQFDATSGGTGTTLTNLTGLSQTVVAGGTYKFRIHLAGVATSNSGLKVAFKYTTATMTSIESMSSGFTASAVATQHTTTTTDQTSLIASTTAIIRTVIEGQLVVNAAGTVAVQAAQNASHADTTSVYVGSFFELTRIS